VGGPETTTPEGTNMNSTITNVPVRTDVLTSIEGLSERSTKDAAKALKAIAGVGHQKAVEALRTGDPSLLVGDTIVDEAAALAAMVAAVRSACTPSDTQPESGDDPDDTDLDPEERIVAALDLLLDRTGRLVAVTRSEHLGSAGTITDAVVADTGSGVEVAASTYAGPLMTIAEFDVDSHGHAPVAGLDVLSGDNHPSGYDNGLTVGLRDPENLIDLDGSQFDEDDEIDPRRVAVALLAQALRDSEEFVPNLKVD
jgi:hypothetical protein